MKKLNTLPAVCAGFVISATVASAAQRNLPTPPKSDYADTESSVNVSLTEWPNLWLRWGQTLRKVMKNGGEGAVLVR